MAGLTRPQAPALLAIATMAVAVGASLAAPAPRADGDPVIAAAGDIACDTIDNGYKGGLGTAKACKQLATSSLLVSAGPTAVLPLGDDQYECGGLEAFQAVYDPTWGQLKAVTYPVPGNHEYLTSGGSNCDTSGEASGYYTYFGAAAGDPAQGYYSYNVGTWHLIALNSNCPQVGGCSAGSQQEAWLKADLAADTSACTLAYFHYPLFSSSGGVKGMSTFWTDLYNAGADVVLSAHKHNYERFAPQTPKGVADPDRGITEFVAGTGGKSHQGFRTTPAANSVVRDATTFGVLELTLHPNGYDWQFAPAAGGTFTDSGSATCH